MTSQALAVLVVASVLAGMGACLDSAGPRGNANTLGVIVSAPVRPPTAAGGVTAAPSSGATSVSVVYVSLPPASMPEAEQATITNKATGLSVPGVVIDGGFDPVPILASVGDGIAVEITGNGAPVTVLLAVSTVRPLKVVRTSPPSGSRDVPLNASIVVVFSEPIDAATLTTGAVQLLRDTAQVPGTVRFADSTHIRAEFYPADLLAPQTEYRLVITQTVRDVNGVAVDSSFEVTFTTGRATLAPAATSLAVLGLPASVPAGITALAVTARDASGRTATGYTGTVHFTSTDSLAVLPADYTFVVADAGIHSFTATFKTLGAQIVTATDAATRSITGGAQVTVTPGTGAPLSVTPRSVVFGNQTIGTTSTPRTVTLTNTGGASEPVSTIMNGFSWTDYAARNDCPSTLGAGASCTISITATPGASGRRTGILVIDQDLPQELYVNVDATGTGGLSVAVVPNRSGTFGKFAYVANSNSGNVSMYNINSATGVLTPLVPPRIPSGTQPVSVAVDPSGKFAYVANFGSNTVSMFIIDSSTGALRPIGSPVPAGLGPVSVAVAPDQSGRFGRFAYVANAGSNDVSMYSIDSATGALTPIGSAVTAQFRPISVAVQTSGNSAYVATDGCPGTEQTCVLMFTINAATGALTPAGVVSPGSWSPASIAVDPSGRFAALVDGGSKDVWMFSVNATTGALTETAFASTLPSPTAVAIDPSGKFAYVTTAGRDSSPSPCSYSGCSGVSMFIIDTSMIGTNPNAVFTFKGTFGAGSYPTSIAIDQSGKFAYVANFGSQTISMYSIATDGSLTLIGTIGT
ncbi:MAG TPA: beta-propeller fold lactonase family protein [Gemmatimonadales bacterium]|nr:beta-propeller fold lactonase family protein [Gemmatimonadales bacterium]